MEKQKQKQNRSPQRNSYYRKESVLDTFQNNQREGALESRWRYKGNKMSISTPVNKEAVGEDHTGLKELRSQPVQRWASLSIDQENNCSGLKNIKLFKSMSSSWYKKVSHHFWKILRQTHYFENSEMKENSQAFNL